MEKAAFLTVFLPCFIFPLIYGYPSCIQYSDVNGRILPDQYCPKAVSYESSNITMICDFTNKCLPNDIEMYKGAFQLNENDILTNQTHTILFLHNLTSESDGDYYCMCKQQNICYGKLNIGKAPGQVENLKMISPNLENLTITWTARNSLIFTNYALNYRYHKEGDNTCKTESIKCPIGTDVCYSCFIDFNNFSPINTIQYVIGGSNDLVKIKNLKDGFIQSEHYVKPNPPDELNVITINSGTVFATWKHDFKNTPKNLSFLYYEVFCELIDGKQYVMYQHQGINTTATNITFNNLLPYTNYSINVRAKLNYTTSYYSDFASLHFITMEDVPQDAPVIVPGLFSINGDNGLSRNVTIYWKDIDKLFYGSANIWYLVRCEIVNKAKTFSFTQNTSIADINDVCSITNQDKPFIQNVSMLNITLTNKAYNFIIKACNRQGEALKFSTIFIPAKVDIMNNLELDFFVQMKKPDPDRLNFTWIPLKTDANITIYWCEGQKDSKNCLRTLNWAYMPKNSSSWDGLPIILDNEYEIATSVESLVSNSGMKWWTDCKARDTDEWIEIKLDHESTFNTITLLWESKCKQQSLIKDHSISYCPVDNCNDPIFENIPKTNSSFILENLKSSTNYTVIFYSNLLLEAKEKSKSYQIATKESYKESTGDSTTIYIVGGVLIGIIILVIISGKITNFKLVRQFKECRKVPEINLPEGILEKNLQQETKLHNDYVINVCNLTTSGDDSKDINNRLNFINVSSIDERYKANSNDKQGNEQNNCDIPDIVTQNNFYIKSYVTKNNDSFPFLRNFDSLSSKYGSLPTIYSYVKKETNSPSNIKLYSGNFLNTYMYFENFKGSNSHIIHKSSSFPDLGIFSGAPNKNQSYTPIKSIQNVPNIHYSQIVSIPVNEVKDINTSKYILNDPNHLNQYLTASDNEPKLEPDRPLDPYMQIGEYMPPDSNELEHLHRNQSMQDCYSESTNCVSLEISQISPYSKCIIEGLNDNINESTVGGSSLATPVNQQHTNVNQNDNLQPMSGMSLEISQISPYSKCIVQESDNSESSSGYNSSRSLLKQQDTTISQDSNLQQMSCMSLEISQISPYSKCIVQESDDNISESSSGYSSSRSLLNQQDTTINQDSNLQSMSCMSGVSPYSICTNQQSVENFNEFYVGDLQPESMISVEESEISPYSKCIIIDLDDSNESVGSSFSGSSMNQDTEA